MRAACVAALGTPKRARGPDAHRRRRPGRTQLRHPPLVLLTAPNAANLPRAAGAPHPASRRGPRARPLCPQDARTSTGVVMASTEDPSGALRYLQEKIAAVTVLPVSHGEVGAWPWRPRPRARRAVRRLCRRPCLLAPSPPRASRGEAQALTSRACMRRQRLPAHLCLPRPGLHKLSPTEPPAITAPGPQPPHLAGVPQEFNILRYTAGQHYDAHTDTFDPKVL